jgi:hypothetical protein
VVTRSVSENQTTRGRFYSKSIVPQVRINIAYVSIVSYAITVDLAILYVLVVSEGQITLASSARYM